MAHDTEKLRELLEWCEKARGPDRMLDAKLYAAFAPVAVSVSTADPGLIHEDGYGPYKVDGFTASLDASIALVERMLPGWVYELYGPIEMSRALALLKPEVSRQLWQARGATLPLAILSALLRALISQAEGESA